VVGSVAAFESGGHGSKWADIVSIVSELCVGGLEGGPCVCDYTGMWVLQLSVHLPPLPNASHGRTQL
jgi:hypothetical protein